MRKKFPMKRWCLCAVLVAILTLGVGGVVLVLTLMGSGDKHATAQPDSATATALATAEATVPAEGTTTPITPRAIKPESTSYPVVVPTPPIGFTLPTKRACPEGWGQISDDMAVYSICVPPGWGVPDPDLATDTAVANAVLHYGNPYIFSPEAFPWPVGDEAKIGEKLSNPDADFVRVILFPATWRTDTPAPTVSNTCEAKPGASIASLPAAACEFRYDRIKGYGQVPNPSGSWCGRQLFVSLPSAKQSYPTDEPFSAVLGIIVEGRCEVVQRYNGVLTVMLGTLQVVP